MNSLFSIIIPCNEIDSYVMECVHFCKQLNYKSYEIILLPDDTSIEIDNVKVISTGPITPGAKRNIGVASSSGDLCAFIDSDAYPDKNWLHNAHKYFEDLDIAAVGGPGLTPEDDSFMQKTSGHILSSLMVGNLSKRYNSKHLFESDDIPSCNFISRRSVLLAVGGWNEKYWPGEDTLICRAIKRYGKRMIEAPDVIVYHHRRPLFRQHLKQISSYGIHRGFFMKRFNENSVSLQYYLPSVLVFFCITGGLLSLIYESVFPIFLIVLVSYSILSFISSFLSVSSLKMVPIVWLGIIMTHVCYGISFMIGLFKRDLIK